MALTPQDAISKARPTEDELQRLEQCIDQALITGMQANSSYITIDADIFPNALARETIEDRYRSQGWDVEYTSDQRDGDFLTFKPESGISNASQFDGPFARPYE
ncbi:MAG: hypothetical protein V1725_04755 [archaeon]